MRQYARAQVRGDVREKRIGEHADMARRIALRLARRLPEWMDKQDLIATAMLGLTEAADRFDETRGEAFIAFAERRIRGAILDELRRGDILPRRVRVTARKIGATIARLEQTLSRPPEDEEIARALDVTLEEYYRDLEVLTSVGFVDLDAYTLDRQRASEDASPFSVLEKKQLLEEVKKGLARVPERDAQVLSLYYVESFTYAEIGEVLGVTESRVCQLHARALARLRAAIDEAEKRPEER